MISFRNALSDEELLALVRSNRPGAEEELAARYARLVRICARPCFLSGGDSEDLIQEGMIGLLSAIREYDGAKGASFPTFAEICVRNRIQSAIRGAARKKHGPLNDSISLDEVLSDESHAQGTQFIQRSPEEQVLARETERESITHYSRFLSKYEARILSLYLAGYSYAEMARQTGRDVKAVDNAVQRIRKKLAKLPSGENSSG